MSLSREELAKSMEMFVLEVRKKDGTEYVPSTLYHMVCGIMRHLRASGDISIDFFKNDEFIDFRSTLDGEMKRLTAKGLGATTKKVECIEIDEEETLWSKGILGDHSPSSLLNTIFYMNGLYFALRSGKEHRQLRYSPCQIKIIEKEGQIPYLEYSEEISKNNPGGLKGRKITPKVVKHYANLEKPQHCFVRIFKKYNRLCPENRPSDAFYLKPMSKPKDDCCFTPVAVGHNTLRQMTKTMFEMGGIKGIKTNHSLRATAATRLYKEGVDEQLIMERTGHHSIDGVRSYKRTSAEQMIEISDILANTQNTQQTKKFKMSMDCEARIAFNNCTNVTVNIQK